MPSGIWWQVFHRLTESVALSGIRFFCFSLGNFSIIIGVLGHQKLGKSFHLSRVSYLSCGSVRCALHRGVVCPKRRQCFHRVCLDDSDGWPGRCSSVMQCEVLETPSGTLAV